jgi:hypothetical protein
MKKIIGLKKYTDDSTAISAINKPLINHPQHNYSTD